MKRLLTHPWLTIRVQIALGAIFVIAISINLFRDNAIDCGCFNVADRGKTHEQRILDMKVDVVRDLGMLLMVGQLWWAGKREDRPEKV